jgi:hypothetical protein
LFRLKKTPAPKPALLHLVAHPAETDKKSKKIGLWLAVDFV